jgi:hypothetical protein
MKIKTLLTIPAMLSLVVSPAFAQFTYIVENGTGGQHSSSYTDAGFSASSGNVNAPGCTLNIGSKYSGTGSFFGPSRYAQFSFAPTTAGYYEVDLAWTLSAGEISTAVNLYTGAAIGNTAADIWSNTGGPMGVIYGTTMNMLNNGTSGTGTGTWKPVTTAQLGAGTTYKVGLYGGYKTPYAGGVTPADSSANRVIAGAARFIAATPGAIANTGIANNAIDIALTGSQLSWNAGQYDSLYNVWFGTSSGSLTEVAAGLSSRTLNLDGQNLQGGTEYFWRVDPVNVDVTTTGSLFDFTTVSVPEPSALALALLGGAGWLVVRRRRS